MKQIDLFTIQCGELSNKKFSLKVLLNFCQHISFLLRQTSAMEEAGWRKLKNSWLLHIGTCWSITQKKVRRAVPMIAWFLKKRLNNTRLDSIRHSEDYSWLKADQRPIRKHLMNFPRPSSSNAKNSDQRAFTYAAVTSIWESYSDQMINLHKQEVSSLK